MKENMGTAKATLVALTTALGTLLGWKGVMLLCWVLVMGLDYLSGTIAACKAGKWASAAAREGLAHKGGMIFVVTVAAIADWILVVAAEHIPMGIQWPGLILPLVLAWYIVTELGSMLENAVALGANVPGWLVKLLKASAEVMENLGENIQKEE